MCRVDVVVVGAHPMDAEILGGVLALRASRRRKRSILVHLTDGSGNYPALSRADSSRQAAREASAAARKLGAEVCWLGWRPADIGRSSSVSVLAERLDEWQPDVVVTHWRGSWHPRHRAAHRVVLSAVARARVHSALYFGENFEDLRGFAPTYYIDTSRDCVRWWRSLESYDLFGVSGRGVGVDRRGYPYAGYYRSMPSVRGLEVGAPLAHAFMRRGSRRKSPALAPDLKEIQR